MGYVNQWRRMRVVGQVFRELFMQSGGTSACINYSYPDNWNQVSVCKKTCECLVLKGLTSITPAWLCNFTVHPMNTTVPCVQQPSTDVRLWKACHAHSSTPTAARRVTMWCVGSTLGPWPVLGPLCWTSCYSIASTSLIVNLLYP